VIAAKRTSARYEIANLRMIYEKVDTLLWYSQILEKHFLEISVIFDFPFFIVSLMGQLDKRILEKFKTLIGRKFRSHISDIYYSKLTQRILHPQF